MPDKSIDLVKVRILPDGRLTRADAAKYVGVTAQTLSNMSSQGRGPRVVRVGGRCFYFKADLDTFINAGSEVA